MNNERSSSSQRSSRLEPLDISARLLPWRRAWKLEACQLYWMPVESFPIPPRQQDWLLHFYTMFTAGIAAKHETKPSSFLQMKTIQPNLRDPFIKTAPKFSPIIGLGRKPYSAPPPLPDAKYAEDLQKGKIQYDHKAIQPDYCYWFLRNYSEEQWNLFLGHGGLTVAFSKPDPENKPPEIKIPQKAYKNPALRPLLEQHLPKLVATTEGAFALQSPFNKKSKELFGQDLKEDPQYPGLLFILPLLDTASFFQATQEMTKQWFSLFDFYLHESPSDRGILLATEKDIEGDLIALLQQMKDQGLNYLE